MRITKPLRLSAHEVAIGQFDKFVEQAKYKTQAEEFGGSSSTVKPEEVKPDTLKFTWGAPGQAVTDDSPVTQVTWNDAVAFCNWLSVQGQLTPCDQRDGDTWTLLPKSNGYRLPTKAVLPAMRDHRFGTILSISSMAAAVPGPFRAAYAASKAALEAWTWGLRLKVRPYGIGVACLQAGDCQTEISHHEAGEFEPHDDGVYAPTCAGARKRYHLDERNGLAPT